MCMCNYTFVLYIFIQNNMRFHHSFDILPEPQGAFLSTNYRKSPDYTSTFAAYSLTRSLWTTTANTKQYRHNTHPLSKHLSAPVQYISLIVTVNGLKLLLALRCISNNENTTTRKREPFKRGLYDAHVILHTLLKNSRTGWLDLSNGAYPLLIK